MLILFDGDEINKKNMKMYANKYRCGHFKHPKISNELGQTKLDQTD